MRIYIKIRDPPDFLLHYLEELKLEKHLFDGGIK
jgi:hypothetical protein